MSEPQRPTGHKADRLDEMLAERETPLSTLQGHQDTVNSVAFLADGTLLVSGSNDGTVRLWGVTPP